MKGNDDMCSISEIYHVGEASSTNLIHHLVLSDSIISAPNLLSSSSISRILRRQIVQKQITPSQRGLGMEYVDERQVPATESTCGCSTMASKPHYKSFKFVDNSQEIRGLKGDKRTTSELHSQKGEAVASNQPGVDACLAWQNPINGAEYPTSLGELEESKGRRKVYIKSNVMDSDMPEMVAFFQDSSHHFVKDIFMNGEVHCKDNCSVENCQLDHNSISSILNFDVESSRASTVGTQDSVPSMSNESEFLADEDCHNHVINQHGSRRWMKDFDGQEDVLVEENLQGPHTVIEVPSKEAVLPNSFVLYTNEAVCHDCPRSAATFRSEVDSTINNIEADCEQIIETNSMSKPEDGMSGSVTSSSRSSVTENIQGESSSSPVDPPPGLIINSGLELYRGSVSLASSGSTAS